MHCLLPNFSSHHVLRRFEEEIPEHHCVVTVPSASTVMASLDSMVCTASGGNSALVEASVRHQRCVAGHQSNARKALDEGELVDDLSALVRDLLLSSEARFTM